MSSVGIQMRNNMKRYNIVQVYFFNYVVITRAKTNLQKWDRPMLITYAVKERLCNNQFLCGWLNMVVKKHYAVGLAQCEESCQEL